MTDLHNFSINLARDLEALYKYETRILVEGFFLVENQHSFTSYLMPTIDSFKSLLHLRQYIFLPAYLLQ